MIERQVAGDGEAVASRPWLAPWFGFLIWKIACNILLNPRSTLGEANRLEEQRKHFHREVD